MMKKFNLFLIIFLSALSFNQVRAEEFVLKSESTFNPTHENRFSLLVGVNPSVTKASDVTNFTFSYGKKWENDWWWDANLLITNGVFNKLTTNYVPATGLTDDQLFGTKSTLTTIGLGMGRETRYAQTLLPFNNIYELMAANLTYNMYKESTSGKTFSSPGMIAKFSVYKRFSDYVSFGTQFIYNLAVVKRSQDVDTESSSARSLTMSNLTVGFDFSFYL